MCLIIVLLIINTAAAYTYSRVFRKDRQTYFLPVFLFALLIPFFGIMITYLALAQFKRKSYDGNQAGLDVLTELSVDDFSIYDDAYIDFSNIMPIQDALTLKDVKQKRKILFRSLNGNCLKVYPTLRRALEDTDAEIIHYASSIITDYRRELYEVFEKARERFASDPKDHIACKEYIETFYDLLCWEELNGAETTYGRKEFEKALAVFFSLNIFMEEKYYRMKIGNEITLNEFSAAQDTCMRFVSAYPEHADPYLALLALYYSNKNDALFKETFIGMKNKEILLPGEAAEIVSFWEGKYQRGIK